MYESWPQVHPAGLKTRKAADGGVLGAHLHFLPDALAAEVLSFVQVVCGEAAC